MPRSIPAPAPVDPAIERIVARTSRDAADLLAVLTEVHAACGPLTRARVADVARALDLPAARVMGVASFYAMLADDAPADRVVRWCDGVVCRLAGAERVGRALEDAARSRPEEQEWTVARASCLGQCDRAPAAFTGGRQHGPVDPGRADALFSGGAGVEPPPLAQPRPGEVRVVLRDPDPATAYAGLARARALPPEAVFEEIERSGLRGRGGAGFPTGRKWRIVAESDAEVRTVVCNADESEPLMFKDRVLIETDPDAVIEGLAIAAYAVGAREGFVYVRGEYEPQARLLERAIERAADAGWLGDGAGAGLPLRLSVHRGAGAYVCGEESALLESLEGRRGEPRTRPPFPAQVGYRGTPTVVNNVETLAAAAAVLRTGPDVLRPGGGRETRLFTLLGHVKEPGLVEAPLGLTVREMIDGVAGGMKPGSEFNFALTGGAAGTLVSAAQLDVPLDERAAEHGVAVGSGGLLVCDRSVSPVELLRELLRFFERESCGKCTPCRIGTSQARAILDRLTAGRGAPDDLRRLHGLAGTLERTSLCGLGTSVAEPITSALDRFPRAFEEATS